MNTSRRNFAKLVAASAAAAPLLTSFDVAAQPVPAQAEKPPESSQSIRFSEAQTSVLRARYGQHITPDEAHEIEKDLDETAGYMKKLREFDLKNSDEPDVTFFAKGGAR